uniref:UDENN domain-containing protein n=1 Tax=Mesocestoides corti TaxID=53468 RepID=A0A5K3FDV6_MESCO
MREMSLKSNSPDLLAEYFAVCGLPEEPTPYDVSEIIRNGEEIVLSESKCLDFSRYSTPIVDIQLINLSQKEHPPDGYQLITETVDGSAECSLQSRAGEDLCICYRRGYDKPPIGDIGLVDTNQRLKANSSNITHTVGSRPAVLMKKRFLPNSNMYFSYSRLPKNYGVDQLALTDICVILKNKGEVCPLGYKELPQKLVCPSLSADMHICYKKSFVKRYIATYQPEVLMWYHVCPGRSQPQTTSILDGHQITAPLPTDDALAEPIFNSVDIATLANFCLPWGAAIESWSVEQNPPRSVFFTFVVTNAAYQKFHGSALTFYEPYDVSRLDRDRCYRLDVDPELALLNKDGTAAEDDLFTPEELVRIEHRQGVFAASRVGDRVLGVTKTICLVSRFDFNDAFRPFLAFLESCCFGPKARPIPLERYLAFMLQEIPFPDLCCPYVLVDLDGYHMRLQIPFENYMSSPSGEPYANLLHRIGSELCLQLIVQLLTEQKLLFISVMPDFLVNTIQQLITLIHPLHWVLVYIPLIHMRCIHVIQSPSPYLIGVDSRFFEFFCLPSDDDITVIDLDTRLFRPAINNRFTDAKCLPKGPYKRLKSALVENEKQLEEIAKKIREDEKLGVKSEEKYTNHICLVGTKVRRACFSFMAELLQDYREFLLPVTSKGRELLFDSEEYVKHAPERNCQPFYKALVETQLWADFVRDLNCISERTPELESFDNCIAQLKQLRLGRHRQRGFAVDDDCSQVSSGSGGDGSISDGRVNRSHSALSVLTNGAGGSTNSPRGSIGGAQDDASLNGGLIGLGNGRLFNSEYSKVVDPPDGVLEMDPLCIDLPMNQFTWTGNAHFPEAINSALLDQLCSRIAQRTVAHTVEPINMHNPSTTSLLSGDFVDSMGTCADSRGTPTNTQEFYPPAKHLPPPLSFVPGNGVPEALGIAKLNSLLKRTQQETTDCLVNATRRRDLGGYLWAELLLSEVYSLWFLLLPAFIASLQQRYSDSATGPVCLEACYFLFHVVKMFLRLWDSVLQPVDQAYVRVLIALLYEYGTSDQGVIQFWSSRPLNAASYAMANQLHRDLGYKLTTSGDPETGTRAISTSHLSEGSLDSANVPFEGCRSFVPQTTLSAPDRNTKLVENEPSDSGIVVSVGCDDSTVSNQLGESTGGDSHPQPPDLNGVAGDSKPSQTPTTTTTKKGWKSFAQASMRKLASFTVEYQNPIVFTLDQNAQLIDTSQPHKTPLPTRSRSACEAVEAGARPIGYWSLFGHPGNSTRLPRNMRPWAVATEAADTVPSNSAVGGSRDSFERNQAGNAVVAVVDPEVQSTQMTASPSWLQRLQRHLPATMSPAPPRLPGTGESLRGSLASFDEALSLTGSVGTTVQPFDSQISAIAYQPPSWHAIAGQLAVGSVGDRVCLANPLVMRCPPTLASPRRRASAQSTWRRSRSSSLATSTGRLHVQSNATIVSSSVIGSESEMDGGGGGGGSGSLKHSPSASSPVLNSYSDDAPVRATSPYKPHARSESPQSSKPPLPSSSFKSTGQSASPPSARVQELRIIFTTCTPCPACCRPVYDEEIMAEWTPTGDPVTVSCPACRQAISPKLTVRTIAVLEAPVQGNSSSKRSASPAPPTNRPTLSHGLIEYSLPFLSPLLLRRQLESVLSASTSSLDCMATEALSSASLLLHKQRTVLLWNLVYHFHRAGLPTHLLDAFAAWLMDAQAEARRLGGGRRVFFGGSLTVARALSEVTLSPDLPVCVVARWDAFPRKGGAANKTGSSFSPMLYRLWVNQSSNNASTTIGGCSMSPSTSVADLAAPSKDEDRTECALHEIVQMAGDALTFENVRAAVSALQSLNPSVDESHEPFSMYRELLMLYSRIHGTSLDNFNKFDSAYVRYLREEMVQLTASQQHRSNRNKDLPSSTVMACRCIFRNLALT